MKLFFIAIIMFSSSYSHCEDSCYLGEDISLEGVKKNKDQKLR